MWIKDVFLGFIGLASGFAVAAGVFAFVVTLGVVPRFAGKTHTSGRVLTYESFIFLGGVFGTLLSIFQLKVPLGRILLVHMKVGQGWVLFAMAMGKMAGALYFYAHHMAK